jgi:hypothetical protein
LAVVRPTTFQLTADSDQLQKLRHNLLHKPALTEDLCIPCINVTYYSAVTNVAQVHSDLDAVRVRMNSR